MITIRKRSQLWSACIYTPAYPNFDAVVTREENPSNFTTCLCCDLERLLVRERERLAGEKRGTNLVSHLMERLYLPAHESLRCQFDDFTADLTESESAVVSENLFCRDEATPGEAYICQLAFRVPTPSADFVRQVLDDRRLMPWERLRAHFPHRLLSAPVPTVGGDGVIITGFTPDNPPT